MRSRVISSRYCLSLLLFLLILLTACGGSNQSSNPTPSQTPTVTLDAYGTPIAFPATAPRRIVSLVPNISEILGFLGLAGQVVGVDYYTNYPANLTSLPKVSDVNGKYNVEQIVALKPDLVLSYGEDTKQYDAQLQQVGLHVVDLPSGNLSLILQEIVTVGRLTFAENAATNIVSQLQRQIEEIKMMVSGTTAPKVLIESDYSTPGKPYVNGGGSFGDELLQDANGINIFHDNTSGGGFPQVSDEAIISANPQFIILTEDPAYGGNINAVYKRSNWGSIGALKLHQVYRINSNIIGRPGPRLIQGLQCLAQIIHPDKFSGTLPQYCTGTV
jgi:ABC-type Fe3+-hydroxamate transport system substrate-binding protein